MVNLTTTRPRDGQLLHCLTKVGYRSYLSTDLIFGTITGYRTNLSIPFYHLYAIMLIWNLSFFYIWRYFTLQWSRYACIIKYDLREAINLELLVIQVTIITCIMNYTHVQLPLLYIILSIRGFHLLEVEHYIIYIY